MSLALLGEAADEASADATAPFTEKLSGSLGRKLKLAPGESATVTFVLAWHFPNLSLRDSLRNGGRYYATKFSSAQAVAQYVAAQISTGWRARRGCGATPGMIRRCRSGFWTGRF